MGTEIMYSPADLEGHKGKNPLKFFLHITGRDGRFYLLDFSRVLPPETPCPHFKNSHLSRVLRPEFVQEFHKPLCSDAFSGFIKGLTIPHAKIKRSQEPLERKKAMQKL